MTACRWIALLALPLVLVLGCSSNNKGKIEGTKWKLRGGMPGSELIYEYGSDGRITVGNGAVQITGTYSLGAGDRIRMTMDQAIDGHTQLTTNATITGDVMTCVDPDGTTLMFDRVKDAPPPVAAAPQSPLGDIFSGMGSQQPSQPPGSQSPLAGGGPPSPPVAMGPAVDLIGQIKPERDQIRGFWRIEGGALIAPPEPTATLVIPTAVPEQYQIRAVVERTMGTESFNIGLMVGGRQTMLVLDGWGGNHTALSLLDGRTGDNNDTTNSTQVFQPGRAVNIVCTVRKNSVDVQCDGRSMIQWSGDPLRLSVDSRFWSGIPGNKLFLASWMSGFRISKLELSPLQ